MATKKEAYPIWKRVVWRYVRVFIAAFLSFVSAQIVLLDVTDLNRTVLVGLLIAAASAGINAISKALREMDKAKNGYAKLIQKLLV